MKTLKELYQEHRVNTDKDVGHGDKGSTHSYIDQYEILLAPYRHKEDCVFMEIGLAQGLSIAMFREYFGLKTQKVIGVDISLTFDTKPHLDAGTALIKSDATKIDLIHKLIGQTFDVVIDDASHMAQDQETTFKLLKPFMRPGGIYIIEDILALEPERPRFTRLHDNCQIIDLRGVKGRFDDVLIVYRF